jgi:hypothetical protein
MIRRKTVAQTVEQTSGPCRTVFAPVTDEDLPTHFCLEPNATEFN